MSFESIWYCCASAAIAICATWWTIALILRMRADRAAIARIEQQQAKILELTKQASEGSATASAALRTLIVYHEEGSGEPGNDEVIKAVSEAREDVVYRMTQLEEAHTASAGIVAQSVAMALPHLRRFSDWHEEWLARARVAEAKKLRALKAGYQRKAEPSDPPKPTEPLCRTKPPDQGEDRS